MKLFDTIVLYDANFKMQEKLNLQKTDNSSTKLNTFHKLFKYARNNILISTGLLNLFHYS